MLGVVTAGNIPLAVVAPGSHAVVAPRSEDALEVVVAEASANPLAMAPSVAVDWPASERRSHLQALLRSQSFRAGCVVTQM